MRIEKSIPASIYILTMVWSKAFGNADRTWMDVIFVLSFFGMWYLYPSLGSSFSNFGIHSMGIVSWVLN
jgi:hypothetical protein